MVLVHVSLVGSGGARQMVVDQSWSKPGMVESSSLQLSDPRSVDDGREAGSTLTGGCSGYIWWQKMLHHPWQPMLRWARQLVTHGDFGEGLHPQTSAGALVATNYGAATVDDGAVDLC